MANSRTVIDPSGTSHEHAGVSTNARKGRRTRQSIASRHGQPPVHPDTEQRPPSRSKAKPHSQSAKRQGKGGVKGGYAAQVVRLQRAGESSSSSSLYEPHNLPQPQQQQNESHYDRYYEADQADLHGDYQPSYGLPRDRWPKGFTNIGNSCYSNSVLQCLLSTALSNALLNPQTMPLFRRYSSNHNLLALKNRNNSQDSEDEILRDPKRDREQKQKQLRERAEVKRQLAENCEWLTEELTTIVEQHQDVNPNPHSQQRTSSHNSSWWDMSSYTSESPEHANIVINPEAITRHPDRLSKCLVPYQQEDAHEFLRALLSTLVMNGRNKQLSSLFDGLLESSVTCRTCGRMSLTRDRYMDLSLDINDVNITSLPRALAEFTKNEILDEDNAVFCPRCNRKQSVTKGLRLATAPSILVCHLKRFAFDQFGRLVRLHKRVQFPLRLNIANCMSHLNKARPPPYELVGILVHQGQTCASGHYVAFVKKHGEWFQCNDSVVTKVDVQTVLSQQAYICMYEVAEMRERAGHAGPSSPYERNRKTEQFLDEDVQSLGGSTLNDPSTISVHTHNSQKHYEQQNHHQQHSQHSRNVPQRKRQNTPHWGEEPAMRILQLLRDAEGFLTEFCCDTSNNGTNEPSARNVQHSHFRHRPHRMRDDYSKDDSTVRTNDTSSYPMRRSTSTDAVMDEKAKHNASGGGRSQTAPRSRRARHNSFTAPDSEKLLQHNDSELRKVMKVRPQSDHGAAQREARSRSRRRYTNLRSRSQGRPRSDAGPSNAFQQQQQHLPPLPTAGSRKNRRSKSNSDETLYHL